VTLLHELPRPARSRIALRVTPDAQRRLRAGHPWLYDGSIRSVSRDGAPGDLAVVFDDDRRFLAIGLWDPHSPIRLKVLHHGKPAQIDAAWFRAALQRALDSRRPLTATTGTTTGTGERTTAYRVVHGENDGLPGLVVDRYAHVAVVKLYTTAWIPHLSMVVPLLVELLGVDSVVLRLSRTMREQELHGLQEGMSLHGDAIDAPVRFVEHGLAFEADVVHGQKTGHFLDQRDNRARVGALSGGARVLDVFSCTGGFSVHAAAGGATAVTSVDSSPFAITAAKRNMELNRDRLGVRACSHDTIAGDAFAVMETLAADRRRFDVVVIDPPSFAQTAAMVERALASYARLTTLGLGLVERGGLLVQASCSSRVGEADFARTVHRAAATLGVDLDEVARTGHPLDHPVHPDVFPEGAYLKAIIARPRRTPRG
jgi:23S rRNA (cytosine1962-C5)-methyltransferase